MGNAKRDDNYVPTLIAVSNADGVTPVTLYADPTTHRLLVSATAGSLDDLSDVVITSGAQGDILYNNGTNWVNLAAGTNGKFLKTQGAGANPIWDTVSAGAAGADTQVQFNDGGAALGGDAGFTFNKTTNIATLTGGLTIYDASNDGNPEILLGSADAEELHIQAVYDSGAQTLDYVLFTTDVASATANKGLYRFNVDGTNILDINDSGISLGSNSIALTGSIGATGARSTKGWFTDLEVTNAIAGSITGNAGTVTNATLTTALTVNTGALTLTANADNTSVLTIGSGAASVSGTNTGDQTNISGNAATVTVADEASDTTCFPLFATAASGSLSPKTNSNLTFNASTGVITLASAVLTTADINGGTLDSVSIGASTPSTVVGTTITANTGFMPDADDGSYLGQSGTGFSDLFLASGGVINWNAGNATLTHSAGLITSNVPLSLGTSNAFTCGTIELGAASDTTISRVSAGVIAVEGVNVLTTAGGTLTGTINLGEGADPATIGIVMDSSMSADERYSGITVPGTAGATLAFGDLCYLDVTATEWLLADASAASTAGNVILGICVDASTDGNATSMLLLGTVRSAAFPASIALGAPVYVSETAGDVTATAPTTTDSVMRRIGFAVTAEPNTIYFNPSNDYVTHV